MANQPRINVSKEKHNTFHYTIILSTCKKLIYRVWGWRRRLLA